MAPGDFPRHAPDHVAVDEHLRQIDAVVPEHPREQVADDSFGDESEPHEDPREGLVAALLLCQRDPHLVLAHHPLRDQQLADAVRVRRGAGTGGPSVRGSDRPVPGGRPGTRGDGSGRRRPVPAARRDGRGAGGRRPRGRGGGRSRRCMRSGAHRALPAGVAPDLMEEVAADATPAACDGSMSRMRASTAAVSKVAGRPCDSARASR